jgi:hypothetical protein
MKITVATKNHNVIELNSNSPEKTIPQIKIDLQSSMLTIDNTVTLIGLLQTALELVKL